MTQRRIAELVYLGTKKIVFKDADELSKMIAELNADRVGQAINKAMKLIESLREYKEACVMIEQSEKEFDEFQEGRNE